MHAPSMHSKRSECDCGEGSNLAKKCANFLREKDAGKAINSEVDVAFWQDRDAEVRDVFPRFLRVWGTGRANHKLFTALTVRSFSLLISYR